MTDTQLQELQQRNEERAKALIESMGKSYLCHPENQVKRKGKKRSKNGRFS